MNDAILILEDEALIAMDIEDTLGRAGYAVLLVCHDVAGALTEIEKVLPVFAFLDLNLGQNETSIEVARALAAQGVPFCFLSGYTTATVCLPDDLADRPRMSKPFKSADLIDRVSSALATSST